MYLELLEQLSTHFDWSRGAGHTHAMLEGAIRSGARILVANDHDARDISRLAFNLTRGKVHLQPSSFLTIEGARHGLMGVGGKFLIDHHALTIIIGGAISEMREIVSRERGQAARWTLDGVEALCRMAFTEGVAAERAGKARNEQDFQMAWEVCTVAMRLAEIGS